MDIRSSRNAWTILQFKAVYVPRLQIELFALITGCLQLDPSITDCSSILSCHLSVPCELSGLNYDGSVGPHQRP